MADRGEAVKASRSRLLAGADWDAPSDGAPPRPRRDWKRLLLVIGLGALSWVATFVGMLELIEANVGELSFVNRLIIMFSVAMLMIMIVWLLDQIFSEIGWTTRLLYVSGYLLLTGISVGFGFGFYWKVLESRGEASRSAESAVGQVQNSLHAGVTRLEQLQSTLTSLTALSTQKAAQERQNGTTCPNSRPGDGPRRQLRDDDAGRFRFAGEFVSGRIAAIRTELSSLTGDLARVGAKDDSTVDKATGTRNEFMRGLNRRLDMTVTGFNTFRSDPQLRQIRADLAERADKVSFADTRGGTFLCPDAQLTTALKGVVRAIDELPLMEKPRIAAVEGSEAVIEAFRRLTASLFGALTLKMPPSAEELRELQKKAVQSAEASPQTQARLNAMAAEAGLSKRDYIPLAIAIFVDLCLLLVSIKKPASPLERLVPKMRAAEHGPVIQILSRFNEIHRDRDIRENFEVFRHVVFDFHGAYYAAIPLNAPFRGNPRNGRQAQGYGVGDAEALVQEAHLLSNLFASFEREKIFSRVHNPFLTTGAIQKLLRRQGSKFAHAEAFRIYRFRDGAWSDIILGAVMGAARRVEGEHRRRAVEDALRGAEPSLPYPAPAPAAPEPNDARPGPDPAHAMSGPIEPMPPKFDVAGSRRGPVPRPQFMPRIVTGAASAADRREPDFDMAEPDLPLPAVRENVVLHPAMTRQAEALVEVGPAPERVTALPLDADQPIVPLRPELVPAPRVPSAPSSEPRAQLIVSEATLPPSLLVTAGLATRTDHPVPAPATSERESDDVTMPPAAAAGYVAPDA